MRTFPYQAIFLKSRIETMNNVERIRYRYCPDQIRILFVGESPPESGKFFYCGNSQMARYMKSVLEGELFVGAGGFFEAFKAGGCYLDDLVLSPVNKSSSSMQKQARRQAIPDLATRIKRYRPRVVVALLKRIEQDVRDAVDQSGVDARFYVTHFPGNGQQGRFKRDVQELLPILRSAIREHKC